MNRKQIIDTFSKFLIGTNIIPCYFVDALLNLMFFIKTINENIFNWKIFLKEIAYLLQLEKKKISLPLFEIISILYWLPPFKSDHRSQLWDRQQMINPYNARSEAWEMVRHVM